MPQKRYHALREICPILLFLLLIVHPSVAYARAGLGELDPFSSAVVAVFFLVAICVIPLGLNGTWTFVWYYAWLQPVVILLSVFLGWTLLRKRKTRRLAYVVVLPLVYVVTTFSTNMMSHRFYADHSDYFPKGRVIERFASRTISEKPPEEEIRAALGEPFAAELFPASSPALPRGTEEYLKTWHLEQAYVLAYYERSRGPKGIEERTYYLFLDPQTHRYVVHSGFYGRSQVQDRWPYASFATRAGH